MRNRDLLLADIPPGDLRAFQPVLGRVVLFLDGGEESTPQAAPTQQTVTQTSIPEYAKPYVENLLGRAQAATTQDVYQPYAAERIAGFSPLQQQAFQNIAGMQVAPQIGQATGLAGLAGAGMMETAPLAGIYGLRGADIGRQAADMGAYYERQATTPSEMQRYMSPYMQDVVDVEKREAQRQAGIAATQRGAQAAGAGAFGGSRQAIMEAEAQRNLGQQLGDIQTRGLQSAFDRAQQAQQYRAGLGLQGYQTGLQGLGLGLQGIGAQQQAYQGVGQLAGQLGQLGQTQYGQQLGIASAQQQAGAQQQALEQQRLTQRYQDFLNQQRFPYQQMAFMSDILRGMPLTGTSAQSIYQAPPSTLATGIGLAGGLGSLLGGFSSANKAFG